MTKENDRHMMLIDITERIIRFFNMHCPGKTRLKFDRIDSELKYNVGSINCWSNVFSFKSGLNKHEKLEHFLFGNKTCCYESFMSYLHGYQVWATSELQPLFNISQPESLEEWSIRLDLIGA